MERTLKQREHETLDREAKHALEEARMVLPGVQALFGFQLVAVFNQPFERLLSPAEQRLHLGALLLTAATVALMMAPAAYHRQAEPHHISSRFVRMASLLLTAGMFALMLSIWMDCFLIAKILTKDTLRSVLLISPLALLYVGLWCVLPRVMRRRCRA